MPIPSGRAHRRPHVVTIPRVARDSDDAGAVDLDAVLRELIAKVPEAERARYAELLLGDRNALADRVSTAQDTAEARFQRAHALALAGRLDEFAAVAFNLPDLNRIEAPLSTARVRAPVAQDALPPAAARVMAREHASAATDLFPNMNRLSGGR